jgi:hypothetical protein
MRASQINKRRNYLELKKHINLNIRNRGMKSPLLILLSINTMYLKSRKREKTERSCQPSTILQTSSHRCRPSYCPLAPMMICSSRNLSSPSPNLNHTSFNLRVCLPSPLLVRKVTCKMRRNRFLIELTSWRSYFKGVRLAERIARLLLRRSSDINTIPIPLALSKGSRKIKIHSQRVSRAEISISNTVQ